MRKGKANKRPATIYEGWKKKDWKGLSFIWPCLSDKILYTISKEDIVEDLWNKLLALYEQSSGANKVFVM